MAADDRLRLMLDAEMSSHALDRILSEAGHNVLSAGLNRDLASVDDPILFAAAQEQGRILITHNTHDFPDILREWAEAGRSHQGCIISTLPTNDYGEMKQRFLRWFEQFASQDDWIDRAVFL